MCDTLMMKKRTSKEEVNKRKEKPGNLDDNETNI